MMNVRDMFDMTGNVVLVTGGGTHLGRAMASSLAELGATVYIAGRRPEICESTASALRFDGLDVRARSCNVTADGEIDAVIDAIAATHGRFDVLVANAGGSFTRSYLPNASADEFRRTLDLNVTGTFRSAQAASRHMIPARRGKIVTIGSIHGILTADPRLYDGLDFWRSGPPYHAAKGAVVNLTRSLAAELGRYNVQVNCISPGQIPQSTTDPEFVERCRLNNPLQRTGQAEDLKGAVALLCSRASDWITGHNLMVDGGWSIW
jgi:gluconate 5-dehydrogenase